MIKRMMLLAMAMATFVAFVAPANAGAEMFMHEGSEITEPIEEEFSGTLGFNTAAGGMSCAVDPVVELDTEGGTGLDLGLTTSSCQGTGALAGCTVTSHAGHWTIGIFFWRPTPSFIHMTGFIFTIKFGGSCPLSGTGSTSTFSSITVSPDNPSAISTLSLSGSGALDTALGALPATISGKLTAANPETIGLE
jgi:hypothetical protein